MKENRPEVAWSRSLEQAVNERNVLGWLEEHSLDRVHLALIDASGTIREKSLGPVASARALQEGWSFIDAINWWDHSDGVSRSGASIDAAATVDLASCRRHPTDPGAIYLLADFDGELGNLSPRVLLKRLVERAAECGIVAEVGWELELIALEHAVSGQSGGTGPPAIQPAMVSNRCWSALTPLIEDETLRELTVSLEAGDVPVDHICCELGPGCLEIASAHRPAVRSADDAAFLKLFAKSFFARRGRTATFMAQLSDQFPGLGGHPSLSLKSSIDGNPLLAESDGHLTKTALSAIAGTMALLPEMLSMAAPTPNSYRRFSRQNWAPSTATWGHGNYSCALRVAGNTPASKRLELRIPGADTSPHLCLLMFLGAVIWGVEQNLEPPDPVVPSADGRVAPGTKLLPRDLHTAASLLGSSCAARELFGSSFVDHYVRTRIAEDEACRRFVSVQEQLRYLEQV